jgi:hypothetical protein
MSRSNLTEAVSAIDRCSDDELRQLQALIAARIGSVQTTSTTGRQPRKKVDVGRGKASKGSKPGSKKPGNPQKTSQYATHPVYKAYRDAKRAVEQKAKEDKVSFKDVTGNLRDVYVEALSNWVKTKSGFRGYKPKAKPSAETAESQDGKDGVLQTMDEDSCHPAGDASEEETPKPKRKRTGSSGGSSAKEPKYSVPPPGWDPDTNGCDWSSLNRRDRKSVWRQHDADQEAKSSGDRP